MPLIRFYCNALHRAPGELAQKDAAQLGKVFRRIADKIAGGAATGLSVQQAKVLQRCSRGLCGGYGCGAKRNTKIGQRSPG